MTEEKTVEMVERMVYVGTKSDEIVKGISELPFEPETWKPKRTGLDAFSQHDAGAKGDGSRTPWQSGL